MIYFSHVGLWYVEVHLWLLFLLPLLSLFLTLFSSSPSPLSLQATRTLDGGKKAGKAGTTQLQPSPNVKSTRKCYSQLGEAASSSETEETVPDTLLSNQGSGEMELLQGEAQTHVDLIVAGFTLTGWKYQKSPKNTPPSSKRPSSSL